MNDELQKTIDEGLDKTLTRIVKEGIGSKTDATLIKIIYQQGFIDGSTFIAEKLEGRISKLEDQLD